MSGTPVSAAAGPESKAAEHLALFSVITTAILGLRRSLSLCYITNKAPPPGSLLYCYRHDKLVARGDTDQRKTNYPNIFSVKYEQLDSATGSTYRLMNGLNSLTLYRDTPTNNILDLQALVIFIVSFHAEEQ